MANRRKTWVYVPSKPAKPTVPAALQEEVEARAGELVESVLKPRHVKPPPDDERFNYIVDIGTKWSQLFLLLCHLPEPRSKRALAVI